MRHDPRSTERVRRVLLALLGNGLPLSPEVDLALSRDEWESLAKTARQHRLEPLLHSRCSQTIIPGNLRETWHAAYRESLMRSLAAKGTLIRAARILDSAGIAYAALKGGWLAWHAYPEPALRPMRDIDVLVSPDDLEGAYRALVGNGFVESTGQPYSNETLSMGLKHLPALRDLATGVHIEVHCRLFEHIEPQAMAARLARPEELLQHRDSLPLEGCQIAYLAAGDTLLHLIVHCIYEHRFDNGPQVLHDIATLLSRHAVDWTHFWEDARAGQWARGSVLMLQMTEHMLGPQPIDWGPDKPPEPPMQVLDCAAMLLLQDPDMRRDLDVQRELGSLGTGSIDDLASLLRRFLPPRRVIADYAGLSPDQRRAWLHYPAWLASRLARTLRGTLDEGQKIEAERSSIIEGWLAAG